jgi:hypothetical protein
MLRQEREKKNEKEVKADKKETGGKNTQEQLKYFSG